MSRPESDLNQNKGQDHLRGITLENKKYLDTELNSRHSEIKNKTESPMFKKYILGDDSMRFKEESHLQKTCRIRFSKS